MSNVKERLIGAITVMDENVAAMFWDDIQNFYMKRASLNETEEASPSKEEIDILDAFERGEEEYQPYLSEEELRKELNL